MPARCICGKRYFMQESETNCPDCMNKIFKIRSDENGCYLIEVKE